MLFYELWQWTASGGSNMNSLVSFRLVRNIEYEWIKIYICMQALVVVVKTAANYDNTYVLISVAINSCSQLKIIFNYNLKVILQAILKYYGCI